MDFIRPSRSLRLFLLCVDLGFLVYWFTSALHLLPAEWLYAHHEDPVMVDWNWSFFPLDGIVSGTGLGALALAQKKNPRWPLLALLSLAFTSASGLNAIAFWALRGDFDMAWWMPNLALLLGPWPFILCLWRSQEAKLHP